MLLWRDFSVGYGFSVWRHRREFVLMQVCYIEHMFSERATLFFGKIVYEKVL